MILPLASLRRRIRRAFARWWHRNICAPTPRLVTMPHSPCSATYAESCSPHPQKHPVVWIGAADADEAWSVMAGGIV